MNQTELPFEPRTHARTSDPVTSHAAAARAVEFAADHISLILACLQDYGPQTKDQIAKRTRLTAVQVGRRLKEMEPRETNPDGKGLAKPNGETRPSLSGRHERVWQAISPRNPERDA